MRIIAPLLKLGLGGGAAYLVIEQGFFNSSQKETIEAAKKLSNSLPDISNYTDKLPTVGISKSDARSYWNSGVKATIAALASFPTDSKELFSKGVDYLKEEIQNQLKNVEKK